MMNNLVATATLVLSLSMAGGCGSEDSPGDSTSAGGSGAVSGSGGSSGGTGAMSAGGAGGSGATSGAGGGSGPPPSGLHVKATVNDLVVHDVSQGWASIRYVSPLKKFLAIFVNHYSPGGYQDNSLRAFDPVSSTLEYLHPKDVPGAPSDRDNHEMVYNPVSNQIWIHNGPGHLILDVAEAAANKDTPPSYGAVGWSADLSNAEFGAAAGISGWSDAFRKSNAVVDWHATLDVGVVWSGVAYTGMGVENDLYLVRPNPSSDPPYVFVNAGNFDSTITAGYDGPFSGRHNGRILGDYFYTLVLTDANATPDPAGGYDVSVDLWRYDLHGPDGADAFVKMAPLVYHTDDESSRWGMYFPCVTADTKLNVLLAYLSLPPPNNLFAYLPETDQWVSVEASPPAGYRGLAACDYSPDHGLHAYQDGLTDRTELGWGTITLERTE